MKRSAFWILMDDEFGEANASVIASSLVLPALHQTAADALAQGVDPREVWAAVCDLHQIPPERQWGRDIAPRDTPGWS